LLDDDVLLKPKLVASNETDINSVVVDCLYFPFTVRILQRSVIDKDLSTSLPGSLLFGDHSFKWALLRRFFHKNSINISGLPSELLAQPVVVAFISLSKQ
jgi:hypothetical protein